ncbi:MAG TPA: hypothetical protein VK963_04600 [Candidatus Saccharimonadales bacterium]|nr:hypothetical protein [Candidatus Saccharimonadales bacterium]
MPSWETKIAEYDREIQFYGNFFVRMCGFIVVLLAVVGFLTAKTMLFELDDAGNTAIYKECIEEDYTDQGSYCVASREHQKNIADRIQDHMSSAYFWSFFLGIGWFWYARHRTREVKQYREEALQSLERDKKIKEHNEYVRLAREILRP